mmetsp:Transcript_19860/g.59355  ORF Transcript_19860/g.59355 Transcript_19860/m.59355 type:complete len:292 (+) Transcript_19860:315-1190(+)
MLPADRLQEAIRPEFIGVGPHVGIAAQHVRCDQHRLPLPYHRAVREHIIFDAKLDVLHERGVKADRLEHHRSKIRQPSLHHRKLVLMREIGEVGPAVPRFEDVLQLLPDQCDVLWILEQLVKRPAGARRRSVPAGNHKVKHYISHFLITHFTLGNKPRQQIETEILPPSQTLPLRCDYIGSKLLNNLDPLPNLTLGRRLEPPPELPEWVGHSGVTQRLHSIKSSRERMRYVSRDRLKVDPERNEPKDIHSVRKEKGLDVKAFPPADVCPHSGRNFVGLLCRDVRGIAKKRP